MRIKSISSIALLALAILPACQDLKFGDEFLSKAPGVEVDLNTVYSDAFYARRALWAAYLTLPYGVPCNEGTCMSNDILECITDLNHSYLGYAYNGSTIYYNGSVTADLENTSNATKYSYTREDNWKGIRRAWLFIENVDRVPNMDDAEKARLKAEAKVIIAIHYTQLFRHFGGVQIIDHSFDPNENLSIPRSTAMETLNFIVKLLDEAIPDLPWNFDEVQILEQDGRMTAAGAMGLKARVLLFAASPLFNSDSPYMDGEASTNLLTWFGKYDKELWERAYQAHKDFFDALSTNGGYGLVQASGSMTVRQAWRKGYFERANGETLISHRPNNGFIKFKSKGDWWNRSYFFAQAAGDYGIAGPTQELVDCFPMQNGRSITDPASGYDPQKPYDKRDPRLYETVVCNDTDYCNRTAWVYPITGPRVGLDAKTDWDDPFGGYADWKTGYRLRKFLLDGVAAHAWDPTELDGKEVSWPYLRLPELYLGMAECIYQTGRGTAEACEYIDALRDRVGVGHIVPGADFINQILNERVCELAFEECRWFDMVRYKREDIFRKKLHRVDIKRTDAKTQESKGTYVYDFTQEVANGYRQWQDNFSPKWYLSAIPSDEVRKSHGSLVQNPGW